MEVEVEYGYEAEQSDELSIKVGDIIKNVTMSEGGWWEGELNGKKGMFPDNFVKILKSQDKDTKKDEGKKKDVQATKRQSVRDLANKLKGQVHEGGPPVIRKKEPGAKKRRAKCVFSYEPENEDELKLEVGDLLEVLKQEEEGWWEGTLNGKQGMFPSNFVEIVDDNAESAENAENKIENTEEHMIKGKKVQGIGLGNIFGDGPIKLRSTGGKKPGDKPQEPPKAEKREDPVQRRLKGLRAVPENINTDSSPQVQSDLARSSPTVSNVQNVVEKHPSFCEDIDYIDSDIAYVDSVDLNVIESYDRKSDSLKAAFEKDLYEFEDVDVNPNDFSCKGHEHIEIKPVYPEEDSDSSSDSCRDIDYNNNRGSEIQNKSYQPHTITEKKDESDHIGKTYAGDYTESLKTILDELDNCLDDTDSEDKVCIVDVDPDKEVGDTSILSALVEGDRRSSVLVKQAETPKGYEEKLQSLHCWKHTSLTPPERLSFCKAIDSVLVTKKRLIDSTEKNPSQTPLHHHHYQEYGNVERAARALNYAAGDLGASGFMKFSVVTDENGSTSVVAKPLEINPRSRDAVPANPIIPKSQDKKEANSKSPKTYFASLNRSGNLSPFIKSIADKYQLFDSEKTHFKQLEVKNFQKEEELDESYTISLLSRQPEESCSIHHSKSEDSLNDGSDLADPLVNQMVNNYVYDVITGEHAGTVSNGSDIAEADMVTDLNGNQKMEDDVSMAVCVDENSVRIVNSKEDLDDNSIEKSDSSTLLYMTEGSEFPLVENSTRPVYQWQSTPFKGKYTEEIPDVFPRESEIHAENGETLPPMQTERHVLGKRNTVTPTRHFQKFRSHGSLTHKLSDSDSMRHSSSYCRIPFNSDAPTCWFSKDFTESPKSTPVSFAKMRSPKRTCSQINEPIPSLLEIAENSHLEEFKGKIEAIKSGHQNLSTDKSPSFLDHRSPAKKRRKRSTEQAISDYHCRHSGSAQNTNWNALAQLPFEDNCNSVDTFFKSRLDDLVEVCSASKSVDAADNVALPGNFDLQHYKNSVPDQEIGYSETKHYNLGVGKGESFCFGDAESFIEKRRKNGLFAKKSSSGTKESPVKLLRFQKVNKEFDPLDYYSLKYTEGKERTKLLKKNSTKLLKESRDMLSSFDQYTRRTLEHYLQDKENIMKTKTKEMNQEQILNISGVKSDEIGSSCQENKGNQFCLRKQEVDNEKCVNVKEEYNTVAVGPVKETFTFNEKAENSSVSSYFGCRNEPDECLAKESDTFPIKVNRNILLLASLGMINFNNDIEVKEAVDSHIKTTDDVVEGDSNVTAMLESRNNMYSAISEAVQLCTEQEPEDNEETPEQDLIDNTTVAKREREQDYSRNEDGCEVTPDVDALVSDLQGLDLSDTPQYANTEADENDMHAFLKEALGSLDDIFAESFTSTDQAIQDESKHLEDVSIQGKEILDDSVEIQNDSVLNVVGKKCILHETEEVLCETIQSNNKECIEILNDPVLTVVGKKCIIHKVNQSLDLPLIVVDEVRNPSLISGENILKDERLVEIYENITEDSFDRSLINKATQSSPQERDMSTQTIDCPVGDTSVEIATQTEIEDYVWIHGTSDEETCNALEDSFSLTMDYDEAYDVDGNKIDDCKAAVALDSYYVYERQPTYFSANSLVGYYHTESVLKNDDVTDSDEDDDDKPLCESSPIADEELSGLHFVNYNTERSMESPGINFDLEELPYLEEIDNESDGELNRTRGSSLDADLLTDINELEKLVRDVDQKQEVQDESYDLTDIKAKMQDSGKWFEECIKASTEDEGGSGAHQELALSDYIPADFEEKVSFYPSPEITEDLNMSPSGDNSPVVMPE